jgi:hypothetical protein
MTTLDGKAALALIDLSQPLIPGWVLLVNEVWRGFLLVLFSRK